MKELLDPLRDELERYDQRLTSFDRERAMQFGALSEQLHNVAAASEGLRDQTQQLSTALRSPTVRGRWGELQLRRVVELAGMAEHCDFETQVTYAVRGEDETDRRIRPDLVVRLPGDRAVIIDAKAPLSAYLDAINATDDRERLRLGRLHSAQPTTSLARATGPRPPKSSRNSSSCSCPERPSFPLRSSTTRDCWTTPPHAV
jgi:DNA recombination protein RmuC